MSSTRSELFEAAMADPRYALEAYEFLCQALAYTQQHVSVAPQRGGDSEIHHVTGQELCEGLRRLAFEQFGLMAPVVFRCWGIRSTLDFGRMVYHLIDSGLWHKSEEDSIDDFADQFDIDNAFTAETIDWETERL